MFKVLGVQNQQRLDTLLPLLLSDTVAALAPTAYRIQLTLSDECAVKEEVMG